MTITALDPAIRDRHPNPKYLDIWTDAPTGIVLGFTTGVYYMQNPINSQFYPVVFLPPQLVLPIGA